MRTIEDWTGTAQKIREWLSLLWNGVRSAFRLLDAALIAISIPFGTRLVDPVRRRWICLSVFFGIYVLALIIPQSHICVAILGFGYLGVIAVGRAWNRNEATRLKIIRKTSFGSPDELPDLRGLALLSALQLAILSPLLFWKCQASFSLFTGPADTSLWAWIPFAIDSFARACLDLAEVYKYRLSEIEPDSAWGTHLLMIQRLTVDLLLVQAVFRMFQIRKSIRDAIAVLRSDPTVAQRVGERATPKLIPLLDSDDPELRKSAAIALGHIGDARSFDALMQALSDPSFDVRHNALLGIGRISDLRAWESVSRLLYQGDGTTRMYALATLADLDQSRVVPIALEALGSEEDEVRRGAYMLLGELGDQQMFPSLVTAANKEDHEISTAWPHALKALRGFARRFGTQPLIESFGLANSRIRAAMVPIIDKFGGQEVMEFLSTAAQDSDSNVRKSVGQCLETNDSPEALKLVGQLARDEDSWTQSEVVENTLIKRKTNETTRLLLGLLDDLPPSGSLAEKIVDELVERGETGVVPTLIGLLDEDAPLPRQQSAAKMIGRLRDVRALSALHSVLRREIDDPHKDEPGFFESLVGKLAQMATEESETPRPAADEPPRPRSSDSEKLIVNATCAVGNFDPAQVSSQVVETISILLTDEKQEIRAASAATLVNLGDDRGVPVLLSLLQDPNWDFDDRRGTIIALGSCKSDEVADALEGILANEEYSYREAVMQALQKFAHPRYSELLNRGLSDRCDRVRLAAIKTLGSRKLDDREAMLVAALHDPSSLVRTEAFRSLQENPSALVLERFREMLRSDQFSTLRYRLVEFFETRNESSLIADALRDRDEYVRSRAISALAALNDRSAIKQIIPFLDDRIVGVRVAAANALGTLQADLAVEALCNAMKTGNEEFQTAAIQALRSIGTRRALDALKSLLIDPSFALRETVQQSIQQLEDPTHSTAV